MSTFACPLTTFELQPHDNADSLSIAKVKGWQCVVKTEEFKDEQMAIYVPLDAVAANDHPLLSFMDGKPVKSCKLRGVLSEGLLIPYSQVLKYLKEHLGMQDKSIEAVSKIDRDFSGILRIRRWYPADQRIKGGEMAPDHAYFQGYTNIENIKNYNDVIKYGEPVHISEKLHGTSARYGLLDGDYCIGSRKRRYHADKPCTWTIIYDQYKLADKLAEFSKLVGSTKVAIYGEIVGRNIQDLDYGFTHGLGFFVYDLMVDGHYLPPLYAQEVARILKLDMVPCLKCGPFHEIDRALGHGGMSVLANHVREGVVIKPLRPRWDPTVGRVILKLISDDYRNRKSPKDRRE